MKLQPVGKQVKQDCDDEAGMPPTGLGTIIFEIGTTTELGKDVSLPTSTQ